MISVILTGHGLFGTGLSEASKQIIGEQEQFAFVDFTVEMSTAQLEDKIQAAITEVDKGEGIVFLTDLLGGTPFRVASLISQYKSDVEVITGTNLQMLVQMLLNRDEITAIEEFRHEALLCGRNGITSLFAELRKTKVAEPELDGI